MADNRTDEHYEQSSRADWDVDPSRAADVERRGATVEAPDPTTGLERDEAAHRDERRDAARVQADAERERLVAERAARRETRLAALAPAPEPEPLLQAAPTGVAAGATSDTALPVRTETVTVTQRSTDKFVGSLGLFLLRLVVAAIVGIRGLYHLLNLPATTEMIQGTVLPSPGIIAIVLGAAEVAIAIGLVFGLLTRLAGLGLLLLAGAALGFVLWGPWSPFTAGQPGFTGELELLLTAVGLLFLLVGGGGWSVDRGFRARRAEARTD